MPTLLPADPSKPRHTVEVELDGEVYLIRYEWRQSQVAWYISLYNTDGQALILSKRLTPGQMPWSHLVEGPPGEILVRGPANYDRKTLGEELQVKYYSESEVDELDVSLDVEVY